MRNRFDEQLEQLNIQLIKMGALCEESIACAVKALFDEKTAEMIDKVNDNETETDHLEHDIEALCMKLLLHQQPVAKDLRSVSSALKMISDMERIADQSQDIAEIAGFVHSTDLAAKVHISDMANEAISMVTMSVDSYVKKDVKLAQAAIDADDKVDARFIEVKQELIRLVRSDAEEAEYFMDLLMAAKYLERIADHATNIAEWVLYSITGERKGTHI
ncbi:MAG: phosphate signaling complex protein PhoU [Oscillospiraceae bacterium]|nr:phosphate signaling complex protein PhoU [Oscillospiraceae bacterium]